MKTIVIVVVVREFDMELSQYQKPNCSQVILILNLPLVVQVAPSGPGASWWSLWALVVHVVLL